MEKWINLTPHAITIVDERGYKVKEIPSMGTIRLSTKLGLIRFIDCIPIVREELGRPILQGVNESDLKDSYVIVSSLIASSKEAVEFLLEKGAKAIFVPTLFKRDGEGKIIGARGLKLEYGTVPCPYCGHGVNRYSIDDEVFYCPHCNTEIEASYR